MCECASISPGRRVIPGRSIGVVPGGTATLAGGPTAAILSPETRTTQPSCVALLVASNTRCGRRRMSFGAGWALAGAANAGAIVPRRAKKTMTASVTRERIADPPPAFSIRCGTESSFELLELGYSLDQNVRVFA